MDKMRSCELTQERESGREAKELRSPDESATKNREKEEGHELWFNCLLIVITMPKM